MRWRVVPKVKNPADWNLFFAIKPVRIRDHKYALCWLYRRAIYETDANGNKLEKIVDWEYTTPTWHA